MPPLTAGYLQTREGNWEYLNFILRNIQDRLDALGGDRGQWPHKSRSLLYEGLESRQDLLVDSATKGLILKDSQTRPHYWRITVDTVGAIVTTDLGVNKP